MSNFFSRARYVCDYGLPFYRKRPTLPSAAVLMVLAFGVYPSFPGILGHPTAALNGKIGLD
jgi:hypothetical protein